MKVLVTSGPSFEPLDQVRRLTNASTGALGAYLCERFAEAGHEVECFKGVGATARGPGKPCRVAVFTTNDSLWEMLSGYPEKETVSAFLHVAALCDFKVVEIEDTRGERVEGAKISSRGGGLTMRLEPARKVLPGLRALFPRARIVGWKYELDGGREDAVRRGYEQIRECGTDACVVNGAAYGEGFGYCGLPGSCVHLAGREELGRHLIEEMGRDRG